MRSLLEYVVSRRPVGKFPTVQDKDKILFWLKENKYDLVDSDIGTTTPTITPLNRKMIEFKNSTGRNCYSIGDYSGPYTNWIRILKDSKLFFIRTNQEEFNDIYCTVPEPCIEYDITKLRVSKEKEIDFSKVKDYMDK